MRPRPPRPKLWPRGQFDLGSLTSLLLSLHGRVFILSKLKKKYGYRILRTCLEPKLSVLAL